MSDLREKLIRLAHGNTEIRPYLLPLIVKESNPAVQMMIRKNLKKRREEKKKKEDGRKKDEKPKLDEIREEKVKNPETGNDVKVKTLENKPKGSPGRNLFEKIKDMWKKGTVDPDTIIRVAYNNRDLRPHLLPIISAFDKKNS